MATEEKPRKMFWEDVAQARERLNGTYVMYGDEAVYIEEVGSYEKGYGALLSSGMAGGKVSGWKLLNDPLFNDFHTLPPLGYVNIVSRQAPLAVMMTRLPERSRTHGLRPGKIQVKDLLPEGSVRTGGYNFGNVLADPGYVYRVAGVYPSAAEILAKLPQGASAAFSPVYAVVRDVFDTYKLFRRDALIGLLNPSGVSLSRTTSCYLEELQETETFNLTTEVV